MRTHQRRRHPVAAADLEHAVARPHAQLSHGPRLPIGHAYAREPAMSVRCIRTETSSSALAEPR
jgi:hypothetical protein